MNAEEAKKQAIISRNCNHYIQDILYAINDRAVRGRFYLKVKDLDSLASQKLRAMGYKVSQVSWFGWSKVSWE